VIGAAVAASVVGNRLDRSPGRLAR
jgi:hypothetical protein